MDDRKYDAAMHGWERANHYDVYGHHWQWNDVRAVWEHDHENCVLVNGHTCEVAAR